MRLYKKQIEFGRARIEPKAIFCFNANVDAQSHICGEEIEGKTIPKELAALIPSMKKGKQKEVKISQKTAKWIESNIGVDRYIIGGQAGNAAQCASMLGVKCYLHTQHKSEKLISLFRKKELVWIAAKKGFVQCNKIRAEGKDSVHYVLEYEKGDRVDGELIPQSNRFIASYDPYKLAIEKDFSKESEKLVKSVRKGLISGLHLATEVNFVQKVKKLIEQWKEINPQLFLHVEMGEFQSYSIWKKVQKRVLPLVDSIGMNELEIRYFGFREPAKEFQHVVVHTPKKWWVHKKCCAAPANFGALLGSYRARTGNFPTWGKLKVYVGRERTHYTVKPASTVGAGDCFAAGYFLTL